MSQATKSGAKRLEKLSPARGEIKADIKYDSDPPWSFDSKTPEYHVYQGMTANISAYIGEIDNPEAFMFMNVEFKKGKRDVEIDELNTVFVYREGQYADNVISGTIVGLETTEQGASADSFSFSGLADSPDTTFVVTGKSFKINLI